MEKVAGLICSVYRDASRGDCTNNGQSSRANEGIILAPGVPLLFEPDEKKPAYVLKVKEVFGKEYRYCVPADPKTGKPLPGWWMMGGNFLYCCDSRFRQEVSEYPLPIHDRQEK